jgi:hypothetical protein
MLLKQDTLRGIAEGRITLAFRRWTQPTVKAGGTLLTLMGQLAIERVDPVSIEALTAADAHGAGFEDLDALVLLLSKRAKGDVYRVAFGPMGVDPRITLRDEVPDDSAAFEAITNRLDRWDRASRVGPWTLAVLSRLEESPGVRAGDLADWLGMEKAPFKANVRKLKGLGLTESLEIGYRLSPRGRAVLRHLGSNS